jgi:hypothetical protein
MHGFAAISAGNGWSITLLGLSVVFSGLAALAVVLSYLPRILAWWSRQTLIPAGQPLKTLFRRPKGAPTAAGAGEPILAGDLQDAEAALRLITSRLGEPFKLPRLLEMAEYHGLARPYSTVNRLILKGALVGGTDGLFRWSKTRGGEEGSPGRG